MDWLFDCKVNASLQLVLRWQQQNSGFFCVPPIRLQRSVQLLITLATRWMVPLAFLIQISIFRAGKLFYSEMVNTSRKHVHCADKDLWLVLPKYIPYSLVHCIRMYCTLHPQFPGLIVGSAWLGIFIVQGPCLFLDVYHMWFSNCQYSVPALDF